MTKKKPAPISGVALVVAQAVDMLVGTTGDEGHVYTEESAAQLVLKQREKVGLALPTPQELEDALAYTKRQREMDE